MSDPNEYFLLVRDASGQFIRSFALDIGQEHSDDILFCSDPLTEPRRISGLLTPHLAHGEEEGFMDGYVHNHLVGPGTMSDFFAFATFCCEQNFMAGLSSVCDHILTGENPTDALTPTLSIIASIIKVSYLAVFDITKVGEKARKASLRGVWGEPRHTFEPDHPKLVDEVKKGEIFSFQHGTNATTWVAPVFATSKVRGFIVAEEPLDYRWTGNERIFLKIVAAVWGGRLKRDSVERKLRSARDAAEEADHQKDKFVSLVAHDLRTPFTSVIGLLRLILADTPSTLTPRNKEMLQHAVKSSAGMVQLIDDLLSVARLKTGHVSLELCFFEAQQAIRQVIEQLHVTAEIKGITLENNAPPDLRLYADFTLYQEALYNLVSNAIKFSPKGGHITIYAPDAEMASIAVRDEGIGIAPERMKNLFRYEKKSSTIGTAGEKGTGLGLPMCQDIMRALSGVVSVTSKQGVGSAFTLELERKTPCAMVVDDDAESRYTMAEILRSMVNADVIEAADGQTALTLFESMRPHIIIVDLRMPGLSGIEVIESIRQSEKGEDVSLLVVTSDRDHKRRREAFNAGANDFIRKPLAPYEFALRVNRLLGKGVAGGDYAKEIHGEGEPFSV